MLMRLLYSAFVLLCFCTASTGQTVTQTPAKVTDFGQLYSTFNWDQKTTTELNTALGSDWAAKVVASSVESAWPSGIATLQGRTDNRPLMATYKLYYLTTIDGSRAVLVAPAAENKHLPANMQSTKDIYFLFSRSAVELTGNSQPAVMPVTSTIPSPARVLDFGQLYSTFNWEENATAELKKALGDAVAAKVIAGSVETAWPSGIASLDGRTTNRPQMEQYKLYYLTTIDNDKAVLLAPAAENKHLPAHMQSKGDIYFLVTQSSVELNGSVTPPKQTPVTPKPSPTSGKSNVFQDQMTTIVADYPNTFENLKGDQIDQDEDGLLIQYDSKVIVDDATAFYFIEDVLTSSVSFHAEYSGSPDVKGALKTYLTVISKVEALKFDGFKLSKNAEEVDGSKRSQVFQAYDPAGNLPAVYADMNIEVRIVQGEMPDKNGQMVSDWYVMLEVYER